MVRIVAVWAGTPFGDSSKGEARGAPGAPGGEKEDGSGTVVLLGVIAFVLTVLVAWMSIGAAVIASHRADAAADLAAIAAAKSVLLGNDAARACSEARAIAVENRARLTQCEVRRMDVTVESAVGLTEPLRRLGFTEAHGRAVAGVR